MAYWLMKSEPDELSISDLQRLGKTRWDGVRNYQARNFIRSMRLVMNSFFTIPAAPSQASRGSRRSLKPLTPTLPRWTLIVITTTPKPRLKRIHGAPSTWSSWNTSAKS